ncbi:hypothetical protein BV349_05390 [Pseudomonas syringae pv. actinidiae]|nr:hypothetical protein BV349_05390 [Pseudomonas syringae pv. actinidiae]OSN68010.1 hypothetical protein BV351_05402 [Pseudomonas syringae pv. actinidiae]RMS12477.1 hypothetical protein ALP75_202991 [Pseudomonas syringae pv. actinidiae]
MSTVGQAKSPARHSAKWQERFNFFETYGAPNDPRFKAGLSHFLASEGNCGST